MANIVRWEPFREMMSLREAMDHLFEDSVVRPRSLITWPKDESLLALDVFETEDAFEIAVPVPGVKPEEIEISVTGDTLTIKGETKAEERTEKGNLIRQEIRYGSFQRSIALPLEVHAEKAEATFENGVLKLKLRKAATVKPKTIKVSVN